MLIPGMSILLAVVTSGQAGQEPGGRSKPAAVRQAQCIKAHPDDKGPWVEGDLFASGYGKSLRASLADKGC